MPIPSKRAWDQLRKVVFFFQSHPEYMRMGNFKAPILSNEEFDAEDEYSGPFAVTEDTTKYGVVDVRGGYLLAGTESLFVPNQTLTIDMTLEVPYYVYVYAECYKVSEVAGWTCNIKTSTERPTQDDIEINGVDVAVQRHVLNEVTISGGEDSSDLNVIENMSQWWQMGDLRIIDRLVL